jgi:hypothetical protein
MWQSDPERRVSIQNQLYVLLHVRECFENTGKCGTLNCEQTKSIVQHHKQCTQVYNCPIPYCTSSKDIQSHWDNCFKANCLICQPFRYKNNATGAKIFNRSLPPQQQQKTVLGIVINTKIAAFTVDSEEDESYAETITPLTIPSIIQSWHDILTRQIYNIGINIIKGNTNYKYEYQQHKF